VTPQKRKPFPRTRQIPKVAIIIKIQRQDQDAKIYGTNKKVLPQGTRM
jgi:hypothetical protein